MAYLSNVGAPAYLVEVAETFRKNIDRRISQIKQMASIDCLVTNLTNINQISYDTTAKMAISHLTELLKSILATGKIDLQLANKIFNLST